MTDQNGPERRVIQALRAAYGWTGGGGPHRRGMVDELSERTGIC
jgi:hypothetical protein